MRTHCTRQKTARVSYWLGAATFCEKENHPNNVTGIVSHTTRRDPLLAPCSRLCIYPKALGESKRVTRH
jgi:hypothetical protein